MTKRENRTQTSMEKRLAPAVAALQGFCMAAGIWALASTMPMGGRAEALRWAVWVASLIGWALPTASNLRYWISHRKPSTGMALPALASLALPCGCALLYTQVPALVRVALWLALVVSCATIVVCAVWFGRFRSVCAHAAPVPPDAIIIVLGGTIRDGRPCLSLQLRLDEALRQWQEAPGRTLVLTGGAVPDDTLTEADYMARDLMARGVPADHLLLESQARNTTQNIRYSMDLLEQSGMSGTLCVLTSDYHLYRAVNEGRACGVELLPIPCPTPPKSRVQQWCREILAILY